MAWPAPKATLESSRSLSLELENAISSKLAVRTGTDASFGSRDDVWACDHIGVMKTDVSARSFSWFTCSP